MLMAGLMTSAVAQEQRFLDVNGWESAGISKSYDRQSQNAVYPMITLHDDGFPDFDNATPYSAFQKFWSNNLRID